MAVGWWQVLGPKRQCLAARQDGGERVVDLVHHAGRELAHRGELLRLGETLLGLAPLGDVLADGDDVRDGAAVLMHRNLGDPVVTRLAARLRFHLDLLQLARVEDPVELALQEVARLTVEHVEDLAAHGVLARHALRAGLALPVPGPDPVGAIDHVQTHGKRVDDLRGEAALRLHLVGAQRHLGREVLRQLRRADHGREDACHHDHHVVRDPFVAAGGDDDLECPERLVVVNQRQPQHRTARNTLALRTVVHPLGHGRQVARHIRLVARGGDRCEPSAVGGAEPEAAATQVETAPQRAHYPVQRLAGTEARLQHRRYFRDDPDTGVLGIEGGNGHRR